MKAKRPKSFLPGNPNKPLIWVVARKSFYVEALANYLAESWVCDLYIHDTEPPLVRPAFMLTWGCRIDRPEIREARQRQLPILLLENGYLGRPASWKVDHKVPEGGYVQASWDRLHNIAKGNPSRERLDMILEDCGLTFTPEAPEKKERILLVCSQVPDDSQHKMGPRQMQMWESSKIRELLTRFTFDRVVWRPHPLGKGKAIKPDAGSKSVPLVESEPGTMLSKEISEASMVMTFNSNAGVEAMLQGVPVDCDNRCHYYGFCNSGSKAREVILSKLAWSQWKLSELKSGAAMEGIIQAHVDTFARDFPLKRKPKN